MTTQEKAKDLIETYGDLAINVTDEMLSHLRIVDDNAAIEYWEDVKRIIKSYITRHQLVAGTVEYIKRHMDPETGKISAAMVIGKLYDLGKQ